MAQSPPKGFTVDGPTEVPPPAGFNLDSDQKAPSPPGFVQRLGEATGFPTSEAEANKLNPLSGFKNHPLRSILETAGGPAVQAGKAAYGYGKNLLSEGRIAARSGDTDSYAPEARFLTRGLLAPVGGTGVANAVNDVKSGNYGGASGDVLGTLINAFLLKKGMAPSAESSANKLAYAAGKDTAAPIKATLSDLRETASSGPKPRTVQDFSSVVEQASKNMTKEVGNALGPIANRQIVPIDVANRIRSLITSNMLKTTDGLRDAAKIRNAALEFEKPWTLGDLDAERMDINKRMNPFYNKSGADQYAALVNRNLSIDKAIADTIRDTVYPRMDQAAGRPTGYFRSMKQRQGDLIDLKSKLDSEAQMLMDTTSRIQGSPRLSRENAGLHISPTGGPRATLYGLLDAIKKPNPLAVANKRVQQGFRVGNPVARGITSTLPLRQPLFQNEEQP
jgi:hypothetical protein